MSITLGKEIVMVNVNTASADDIRSVPGIGRKGAKNILDRRDVL